jgi:hypothetical protein
MVSGLSLTYASAIGEDERFLLLSGQPGSSSYLGTGNESALFFEMMHFGGGY